jgi:RHS repeat-associated protein
MKTRYTNDPNGEVFALRQGGSRYAIVADPQGNVRSVRDQSGVDVDAFSYWPYGEVSALIEDEPVVVKYGGAAGYQSSNSRILYVRARMFSPTLARWITKDYDSMNTDYIYCANNPIKYIDPSGHQLRPPDFGKLWKFGEAMWGASKEIYISGGIQSILSSALLPPMWCALWAQEQAKHVVGDWAKKKPGYEDDIPDGSLGNALLHCTAHCLAWSNCISAVSVIVDAGDACLVIKFAGEQNPEKSVYNIWDLNNNRVGREVGRQKGLSAQECLNKCRDMVHKCRLRYLGWGRRCKSGREK